MLMPAMAATISLLRGVNVGGNNLVAMGTLRDLYNSIGMPNAQTYVQSGNVVCLAKGKNLAWLGKQIEDAIERKLKFRPEVVLRDASEMKAVIAKNPFAKRPDIPPNKLLVIFLNREPDPQTRELVLGMKFGAEEVRFQGREIYIYFPEGVGKSKLWPAVMKALKKSGTGRNWNTVMKLSDMASKLEKAG